MKPVSLPPDLEKKIDRDEKREITNPVDVEKLEANLRMTKVYRGLPAIEHQRRIHKQKENT